MKCSEFQDIKIIILWFWSFKIDYNTDLMDNKKYLKTSDLSNWISKKAGATEVWRSFWIQDTNVGQIRAIWWFYLGDLCPINKKIHLFSLWNLCCDSEEVLKSTRCLLQVSKYVRLISRLPLKDIHKENQIKWATEVEKSVLIYSNAHFCLC